MLKIYSQFLLVFLFFATDICLPQEKNLRFERVSLEQGLAQSVVYTITQDPKGFLWIGTQAGLNRFDGYQFTLFENDPDDDTSLVDNFVQDLEVGAEGDIWVGTKGGLQRYNQKTNCFTHWPLPDQQEGSAPINVRALMADRSGNLWISLWDQGIQVINSKTGVPVSIGWPQTYSKRVYDMVEHPSGKIFLASLGGFYCYYPENNSFKQFLHDPEDSRSLSHNRLYTVVCATDGSIWLGAKNGLNHFDPEEERFRHFKVPSRGSESTNNWIMTVAEDQQGNLWMGTWGAGLHRFNRKSESFQTYTHNTLDPTSLSGDKIWTLFEDASGVMWAGTSGHGLSKFCPSDMAFRHLFHDPTTQNSLSHNQVFALLEDHNRDLWIGTNGGLDKYQPGRGTIDHFEHDPTDTNSLSHNHVWAIAQEPSGILWVGTGGGGLNYFDPREARFTHYRADPEDPKSLSNDYVYCLSLDDRGNLWAGTDQGLNRWDPGERNFTRFRFDLGSKGSLRNNLVRALLSENAETLWVGTDGGGLSRLDVAKNAFEHFTWEKNNASSLSNDQVTSILEPKVGGGLWVGTNNGLNYFDTATGIFQRFSQKNGLPSNVIYGLIEDRDGYLWASTNRGLSRRDPQSNRFQNFNLQDGLQSNEFNNGAVARGKSDLFFGGINGLNLVNIDHLTIDTVVPQVAITQMRIFNQPVQVGQEQSGSPLAAPIHETQAVELSYKDKVVSFEFAALHYANPSSNRYAYMLEGLDRDWIFVDANQRFATYSNLAPGDYVFRVKAGNRHDVWNEKGVSLGVSVSSPPWRTWWAWCLYGLMLLGLIWIYHKNQKEKLEQAQILVTKLRQVDKLKDDFLTHSSHEFRTPLNGIIGLTETLLDNRGSRMTAEARESLALIATSGRRLSRMVNDILDFSQLKNKSLVLKKKPVCLHALTEVVLAYMRPLIGAKKLEIKNEIEPKPALIMGDEIRLQSVLQNLICNAIAFTERGTIKISSVETEDEITIQVSDTGIGIPEEKRENLFNFFEQVQEGYQPGMGLGLSLSRHILDLHGGQIWLEQTQVGVGTTVAFTLPIYDGELPKCEDTEPGEDPSRDQQIKETLEMWNREPLVFPAEASIVSLLEKPFHILIVDDDRINLRILENVLAVQNVRVTTASNGDDALMQIAENGPFDLVLLDIMMPKVSGIEVCRKIRQQFDLNELPIIFLTAKDEVTDLVHGFDSGANDYLTKPVSKNELLARVKLHLYLLDTSRNLEDKVKARTQQLQRKNQQLDSLNKDLQDANHKLEQSSLTDSLTGLGNRRYLFKYLRREVAMVDRVFKDWSQDKGETLPQNNDLIFLMLDLDHFKRVNDAHGHDAGDRVLIQIKDLMKRASREQDLLIRWGGEEFLIISRLANRAIAPKLAERVRKAVESHPFDIGNGRSLFKTCTVGFAVYPFGPQNPFELSWEQVLRLADMALYIGKNSGRNAWVGLSETKNTNPKRLFPNDMKNLEGIINRGEVALQTSIPTSKILKFRSN